MTTLQRDLSIYKLMKQFRKLNRGEVKILDYLMEVPYVEDTYSGFARTLGCGSSISSMHKCMRSLEKKGIITISGDNIKRFEIADSWIDGVAGLEDGPKYTR